MSFKSWVSELFHPVERIVVRVVVVDLIQQRSVQIKGGASMGREAGERRTGISRSSRETEVPSCNSDVLKEDGKV